MKILLVSLLIAFTSTAHSLTITTLNLEWFGRGGDIDGTAADEHRQKLIHEFTSTQLQETDLFVFQEILNLPLLAWAFPGWDCRTYEEHNLDHQHVAVCARPGLVILNDFTIESVRLSSNGLRPAYRIELSWGPNKVLSVIGLHLKAGKESTEKRLTQIRNLLAEVEAKGPMIILGDFNTFPKDRTGLKQDDVTYMRELFAPLGFDQVGGNQATYLEFGGRAFDLVWERELEVTEPSVGGPCRGVVDPGNPFTELSYYMQFISDHCPVTVEITAPN